MELLLLVALAFLVSQAIRSWVLELVEVPTGSMEPTIEPGQRLVVNRLSGHGVGDIVLFSPPALAEGTGKGFGPSHMCAVNFARNGSCPVADTHKASGTKFTKRIVAGPGDTVAIRDGRVVLNGALQEEGFIKPCAPNTSTCNLPVPVRVPEGHWFLMGDNRGESGDSRFWGPLPDEWIVGKALAIYWPPTALDLL